MEDRERPEPNIADSLGFVGLAFAVVGLCNVPLVVRLGCLLSGSVFLSLSFSRQTWPSWVRWMLSLATISFLGYVGASAVRSW